MIFDNDQQKNFILDAVSKYPTNYQNALQLANAFGLSIQNGRVIPNDDQLKALPLKKYPIPAMPGNPQQTQAGAPQAPQAAPQDSGTDKPETPGAPVNGNRRTRRAAKATKK